MFIRSFGVADIARARFAHKSQTVQPLSIPSRPKIRPRVNGKFVFLGNRKLHIRGVTYGTFCPDAEGNEFPSPDRVEKDFCQMDEFDLKWPALPAGPITLRIGDGAPPDTLPACD